MNSSATHRHAWPTIDTTPEDLRIEKIMEFWEKSAIDNLVELLCDIVLAILHHARWN